MERDEVHITHSSEPIQTNPKLDAEIELLFAAANAKRELEGRKPFTRGSLASLRDLRLDPDGLRLIVAETDYGKFIGSAHPYLANRYGIEQLHLSVAICNFVVTADEAALFHYRGEIAYPDKPHVVGGMLPFTLENGSHPHPFDAMIEENVTELGVMPEEITSMVFLGVANDMNPGRMNNEFCFSTRITLTVREVLDRHAALPSAGRTEGDLILMNHTPETVEDFLTRRASIFVPTGWACALMHGWNAFGENWMPLEA